MEDRFNNFESYFGGRMSAKESLDFQTALSASPELKAEYDLFLQIKKATSDIQKDEIRGQLEDIGISNSKENIESSAKQDTTKIYSLLKWASSIAALFVIGFLGYQAAQGSNPDQLFAQHFEVYEMQQSRGEPTDLPELDSKNLNTPELKLFYAATIISEGREAEAIKYLTEVPDESTFRNQKYWYLGLANLKSGNITEAKRHFNHLRKLGNYKKTEIEDILSKLN